MNRLRHAVCVLLSALLAAVAVTPPATAQQRNATSRNPSTDAFGQRIARLSTEASSRDAAERARALKTLTTLQIALLDSLATYAEDPDPEVRARVVTMLTEMQREIQDARAMSCLGPQQRAKLDALRRSHPTLCRAMLGESEDAKLAALREIDKANDRERLYEPLVLLGLHSRHNAVQLAAIEAVMTSGYADARIADRLADLALSGQGGSLPGGAVGGARVPASTQIQALAALSKLASPETAGRLAAAACTHTHNNLMARPFMIADAAVDSGDKGLLLSLLPLLERTKPAVRYQSPAGVLTTVPADVALYIMLRLTNQPLEDYGMQTLHTVQPTTTHTRIGFGDDESRAAAIAQYTAWWERNKTKDAYKKLTPTPLPANTAPVIESID
ncbi:MAG: hypothetical protein FWE88_05095 [Phycisphaerae bacterium]|nr:hypothetical protein [Phycisphaerae bacterium]